MIPEVGTTCSFTFKPRFASLNGVYTIASTTTYLIAVASGINFVSGLYTPAGLSQTDYNADASSYTSDRIAVLELVSDTSVVYYVPESVFATVPDPTIQEYYPLILTVNLGVQLNVQAVLPLVTSIGDLVTATLGTTDPLRVVTNPAKKVYLTNAEYETLVTAREANIAALSPVSVQLKAAQDLIILQAAKIASYEALLAAQATANPD